MALVWWEKTVEYAYIFSLGADFFCAPMDGNHEGMGDLLLAEDSKFIMIEFKRTFKQIKTEIEKFIDYKRALEYVISGKIIADHHFVIYGSEDQSKSTVLQLSSVPYFNCDAEENKAPDKDSMKTYGIEAKQLKKYLTWFLDQKKKPSGGSGGDIYDYTLVAAVGAESGEVVCVTLGDFMISHKMQVVSDQKKDGQTQKLHAPGM